MKISFTIIFCCVVFLNVSGIFAVKEGTNVKGGLDVKETIEKFLKDLQTKIPEVFTFADQNFTLPNNKYVTGTASFNNVSCTGLKEFNATVIYRNILPLPKAYILTLENISLHFDYKSDITIYNSKYFSLFGQGSASISLKNLIFDGNVSISVLPMNASTTADVDLDNVLVNVTGLLDDENFSTDFGKFLGKSITIIFEENKQTLSKTLTETLNFILQDIIKHRRLFHDDEEYDLTADLLRRLQNFFNNLFTLLIEK